MSLLSISLAVSRCLSYSSTRTLTLTITRYRSLFLYLSLSLFLCLPPHPAITPSFLTISHHNAFSITRRRMWKRESAYVSIRQYALSIRQRQMWTREPIYITHIFILLIYLYYSYIYILLITFSSYSHASKCANMYVYTPPTHPDIYERDISTSLSTSYTHTRIHIYLLT